MSVKKSLAMDAIAFILCVASFVPQATGVAAHEWLGLVASAVFLAHVAMHVKFSRRGKDRRRDNRAPDVPDGGAMTAPVRMALDKSFGSPFGRLRAANLVIDAALFVVLAVVAVSGLGVSGAVLPTFGLYADGYCLWNPLHAAAAKVLLALLIVHLTLHVRFVAAVLRKPRAVA